MFESCFEVPMIPVAKGRPKAAFFAGRAHLYTPAKTRDAEATFAALAAEHRPPAPLEGPVAVSLEFVFVAPKSWPGWQREAAVRHLVRHMSKPDLDNLKKLALDAMTAGGWWRDDAQVCELDARKVYGVAPATKVRVREIVEVGSATEWKCLRGLFVATAQEP